jgi:hypothetical protein
MDTKHFELLLRRTTFGHAILTEAWGGLTTKERIELLLHSELQNLWPSDLRLKALHDPNPAVRMLAVMVDCPSKHDDPDLYAKVKSDPSPLVRAAVTVGERSAISDLKDLIPMPQLERLGVVALSQHMNDELFAEFIVASLQNQAISEEEAAALVYEFVLNPSNIFGIERTPLDGMDWFSISKGFEAIWNLTTCTPWPVHYAIGWHYPLQTGDGDVIPDEMLGRMSVQALEALVFRRYKPLLDRLQKTPEQFDKKVHEAEKAATIGEGTERGRCKPPAARSETEELRRELDEIRTEMRELFEALREQVNEASLRRRGLLG